MKPDLRVSVIIPCFNAEAYLLEAITSVTAQTVQPDEIIVVDDGSTDRSLSVLERSGSPAQIVRQSNRGVSAARNAGIRQSSGAVLAFLDADDAWPTDSLAVRLAEMERTGADLVAGRVRQSHDAVGADAPAAATEMVGRLAGSMLVRRNVFERVGYFDERLRSAETIDWIARARDAQVREAHCEDIVLYRRIHQSNMMQMRNEGDQDRLAVLRNSLARRRRLVS